jgi:hypothetical protein
MIFIRPIPRESIIGAILNFLVFWPHALIISNFFHLPPFELIKDKVVLKAWYILSYAIVIVYFIMYIALSYVHHLFNGDVMGEASF